MKRTICEFGETFAVKPRIHLTKAVFYVKVDNIVHRYLLGMRSLGSTIARSRHGVGTELAIDY